MFSDLENYAKEFNVPIMMKDGIEFLVNYIKENNYKNILEIGTAIGYSAIKIASIDKDIKVITIERNDAMYEKAKENIAKYNLENQITVIKSDALEVDITGSFDLIFIDAAKSQYIKFFNKFSSLLNEKGTIITDNLNFHGLREVRATLESKNLRSMMNKLNDYIEFLKDNTEYKTEFIDIGDGIGITKKVF